MQKIIALIDGSQHSAEILTLLQQLAVNNQYHVKLFHIVEKKYEAMGKYDLSGTIGLGARSNLLKELSDKDAEIARREIEKARIFMEEAKEKLQKSGIIHTEIELRHGTLIQALDEIVADYDMVIMAKSGESSTHNQDALGSNFEEIVQHCQKPILIAANQNNKSTKNINNNKIEKICISYDGSAHAEHIIDYLCNTNVFPNAKLHCIMVGEDKAEYKTNLSAVDAKLSQAGYNTHWQISDGDITQTILNTIEQHNSDLLLMGAYGHSRLRRLFVGSTTSDLIKKSNIPILIIH